MKTKKSIWVLLGVILLVVVVAFFISSKSKEDHHVQDHLLEEVAEIEEILDEVLENDINLLSSHLDEILENETIKQVYLEKDRDKLYNLVLEQFTKNKDLSKITHWYFILADGHTFLRVHNPDFHGDLITRYTFQQTQESGERFSGIELGKTAYALRVVSPYYHEGKLIGYVELGEEVDHFLNLLREEMKSHDFALGAQKKYLDEEKWASVKSVAGLRNNWDDLEDYVIISPIDAKGGILNCVTNENIDLLLQGNEVLKSFKYGGKDYGCVGFPFVHVGDRHAGVLFSSEDVETLHE